MRLKPTELKNKSLVCFWFFQAKNVVCFKYIRKCCALHNKLIIQLKGWENQCLFLHFYSDIISK